MDDLGEAQQPVDLIPSEFVWGKAYEVDKESFDIGKPISKCNTEIYTDGSRHSNLTGMRLHHVQLPNMAPKATAIHLGKDSTVFQAELFGIKEAADHYASMGTSNQFVIFYVDSRAALLALAKSTVDSKLVKDTISALNGIDRSNRISLKWIKAHAGHRGNEKADELAKKGALDRSLLSPAIPNWPLKALKARIHEKVIEKWQTLWQGRKDCRQTKIWFPKINKRISYDLLRSPRPEFSLLVQLFTGHNYLKRHQAIIDQNDDNECRLCMEDEESSFHILAECPALAAARLSNFGLHAQDSSPLWVPSQVISFLREANIDFLQHAHLEETD